MGDSFVEGDILSSDLREKLQLRFGGSGAGFAPMASPLTGFRRTIKTQSKGWDSYNIMQRRNTPAAISDYYYISAGSANLRTEPPFAGKVHRTGLAWTVAARPDPWFVSRGRQPYRSDRQ